MYFGDGDVDAVVVVLLVLLVKLKHGSILADL